MRTIFSAVVDACRSLIRDRFHDEDHRGAAAIYSTTERS
jgi:hypothetical protein